MRLGGTLISRRYDQLMRREIELITYQDEITEFLHLHACLERQLQLATFDDDVREIQQMDLERICQRTCQYQRN